MVELRDVFKFPSFSTFETPKTSSRTPPRASFFSFSFRRKPPDKALVRIRFTYFAKQAFVASGQIIPRFVESGAPFRRRRRRFDAVSYFIAISAPKRVLFRKVRVFFLKKRLKKEKKRKISRFFLFRRAFSTFRLPRRRFFFLVWRQIGSRRLRSSPTRARFRFANAIKKSVARTPERFRRSTDFPCGRDARNRRLFHPFPPVLHFVPEILVVCGDVTRRLSANFLLFISGDDRAMNLFATSRVNRMNDVDVLLIRREIGDGGGRSVF